MGTETKRDLLALFAVDAERIGVGQTDSSRFADGYQSIDSPALIF